MNKLTKDMKKVINKKDDWIMINIYHESYFFGTDVYYYTHTSIKDIIKEWEYMGFTLTKLEEFGQDKTRFLVDLSGATNDDNLYMDEIISKEDLKHLTGYKIFSMLICSLTDLQSRSWMSDKGIACQPFCWGKTDKKYGLIDYKRTKKEKEQYD